MYEELASAPMADVSTRSGITSRVRVGEVMAVIGGAVLLAGSWIVVVAMDDVPLWEERLFNDVNGLPDFVWPIIWLPMQLGSFVGSLIVVALIGIISRSWRLTAAALVASQIAWWSAKLVKNLVGRGRPSEYIADIHLHEHAGGLGYASGHSAVAFALAAVVAPSLPRRWQPVAWVLCAAVAFGRVYAGAHLPLDVVGGAGIGLLVGTLTRWAFGLGGEGLPVHDAGAHDHPVQDAPAH
jgi:membrane-associated phospholipid phosphatase